MTSASVQSRPIPLGRFRHFKGNEYEVQGMATHSETLEAMVIYRPVDGAAGLWVRPLAMFLETVTHAGKSVRRFEYVAEPVAST